jgi:hypothetical protein
VRMFVLLGIAVLGLSGCMVMSYPEVEYESGTNPFSKIQILNDQGHLEVLISDDDRDLSKLRITEATCSENNEKEIPTTLKINGLSHSSTSSPPYFVFIMNFQDDRYFAKLPLHLKFKGFYGAEPFTVDALFTTHTHHQVVNFFKAVDP